MLISRTPMRISFVGGGTDLAQFYRHHGGAVVSMSINKYFYLSMHPAFQDERYLLKYSTTEIVKDINKINHEIIREVFRKWDIPPVDFSSAADIPAGTGLGSSSAFTSGLISLCNAYHGRYLPNERVAEEACHIEIDRLGASIGKQDQYGCAVGGLKLIEFMPDDTVVLTPIHLDHESRAKLEQNLHLVYIGGSRSADEMLKKQISNMENSKQIMETLIDMASQAQQLRYDLMNDIDILGEYLHEGWIRKKRLSGSISTPIVESVYEIARKAGATGGKLLGAGGAGFLLLYIPSEHQQTVRAALPDFYFHTLKIDNGGSMIIYDDNTHSTRTGD